jgi:hypothetical protein
MAAIVHDTRSPVKEFRANYLAGGSAVSSGSFKSDSLKAEISASAKLAS